MPSPDSVFLAAVSCPLFYVLFSILSFLLSLPFFFQIGEERATAISLMRKFIAYQFTDTVSWVGKQLVGERQVKPRVRDSTSSGVPDTPCAEPHCLVGELLQLENDYFLDQSVLHALQRYCLHSFCISGRISQPLHPSGSQPSSSLSLFCLRMSSACSPTLVGSCHPLTVRLRVPP